MITIERTTDADYIKSVITNTSVYRDMVDDTAPLHPEIYHAPTAESLGGIFLKVICNGIDSGFFWLKPDGEGYEVHTALLPNCRGRNALLAGTKGILWTWLNTKARFLGSYVWSDAPHVAWFCKQMGFIAQSTKLWHNTRGHKPVYRTYFKLQHN